MSKKVYSIENQTKFNIAMIVGHMTSLINGTKYQDKVKDWTYDIELASLAFSIYKKVKDQAFTFERIRELVAEFFNSDSNASMLANAESDEDYQDYWYGVECGSYFGMPTTENLQKCNCVMKAFMDDMKYGFVHEVIESMFC